MNTSRLNQLLNRFIELITGTTIDRLEVEECKSEDPSARDELRRKIHEERTKSALTSLVTVVVTAAILWVAERLLPEA